MPPPDPRSSTTSPARRSATAVGLPQPRLARTAASGSAARSSTPYRRSPNRASSPVQQSPQPQPSPEPAAVAASAYFRRTSSRTAWSLVFTANLLPDRRGGRAGSPPPG